jgi:hypothetical protein
MRRVAGLLCLAAVVVAGCGSGHKGPVAHLDTRRIAHKIKLAVERRNLHLHITVSCPAVVVRKQDGEFKCPIVTRDGHKATALVRQLNGAGRVRYFILNPPWRPRFGVRSGAVPRGADARRSNHRK